SKQPAEQDDSKARAKDTEASVLELASLDDEALAARPARETEAEHKPPEAAQHPPPKQAQPTLKQAVRDNSRSSSSNIRSDVLAELLPQDNASSASNSDPLLLPQGSGYLAAPRFKRRGGPANLLKSPWFWSAVIWLVAAILLLVLLFRPSPSERATEKPPAETAQRFIDDEKIIDFPDSPLFIEPSEPLAEIEPSVPPGESPSEKPAEQPPAGEEPRKDDLPDAPMPGEKPDSSKPEPSPEPKQPDEAEQPSEQEPEESKPAPPTEKKPDPETLLAGVKKIAVRFRSSDPDPSSTLNLTIKRQALDALKQLGIDVEDDASSLLVIDVKISSAGDVFNVEILSIVGCPLQGYDKPVAVWKLAKPVVSIPTQRLRQDQVLRVLRIGAKDFFDQLVEDVRKARIHAKFQ
ncbi:MAG: hypothetical protein GX594_04410, partial [Pirellulaceae bacterium]|nr:hypothetical protein [Pirellulaceae bacterium]